MPHQREQVTSRPFKFPLTFSELLRYLMPKKRPRMRMVFFHEYVRHCLRIARWHRMTDRATFESVPIPPDSDVGVTMNVWKTRRIDNGSASTTQSDFDRWLFVYTRAIRRKRAQTAASGRWHKKSQKSPTARKHQTTARKHNQTVSKHRNTERKQSQ